MSVYLHRFFTFRLRKKVRRKVKKRSSYNSNLLNLLFRFIRFCNMQFSGVFLLNFPIVRLILFEWLLRPKEHRKLEQRTNSFYMLYIVFKIYSRSFKFTFIPLSAIPEHCPAPYEDMSCHRDYRDGAAFADAAAVVGAA